MRIGGTIKGRQCSFVPEIALCSSKACEMYCCRTHADNEKERFLEKFLISKMLFKKNLFYLICILCDPYFIGKVVLSIRSRKDFLCDLV